ncbi:MAG TPA: hemerythrin domain-containing protein [Micromonosporaceae bacterium]
MVLPEPAADQRAARAVINHHTELAAALTKLTGQLLEAAEAGDPPVARRRQNQLVAWLREELMPHAQAEEAGMYPAAAGLPDGRLLIEGMLGEHRTVAALVAEIEDAASPVAAAAAARALQAVFADHLAKENDLVVPLLVAAGNVSLAGLLDGMHEILGAGTASPAPGAGEGCGCGGCECGNGSPAAAEAPEVSPIPPHQTAATG